MVEGNTFQPRTTRFGELLDQKIEDDDTAEHPHSLSSEERELPTRDSFVQVYGEIRKGVTQSLIECALTGQPTGPAIYSLHLAWRTTRPAENSCGGKSSHLVKLRQCHSQPRRNRSGENPILCCNLPYGSYHARRKVRSAENSSGGKSGHPVQPRHSQPL